MKWTAALNALIVATLIAGCADTSRDRDVLLGAGVDHRVAGKSLSASNFSSWGSVETMMQQRAARGSYNLCELQKRSTCVESKS